MGHTSGGSSRAHRYPQTLQRHTGMDKFAMFKAVLPAGLEDLFSAGGRLSGIGSTDFSPLATARDT